MSAACSHFNVFFHHVQKQNNTLLKMYFGKIRTRPSDQLSRPGGGVNDSNNY